MNKYILTLLSLLLQTLASFCAPSEPPSVLQLGNEHIRVLWQQTGRGWEIKKVQVHVQDQWQDAGIPSGEYTLLYDAEKPSTTPAATFRTAAGTPFPEPVYKYMQNTWAQATAPVSLNTAGQAVFFFPDKGRAFETDKGREGSGVGEGPAGGQPLLVFNRETAVANIISEWRLDPASPGDIIVRQILVPKKAGYFSLASPSLVSVAEKELAWATVPGYFQGGEAQKDFVSSYAYGHGVPEGPVVYRERCASTLCPIISTKQGISLAVIPDPGLGRDPWAKDTNTHRAWRLGLSHRNRRSQLSPTLYYPVVGEPTSLLHPGDTLRYEFRYSLVKGDWYTLLHHAIDDIYHFKDSLALRHNRQSLSRRMERMQDYLSDSRTAMWHIEEYNGMKIGAQSYLGGVVGSDKDAMKNSDYGAMWMIASISGKDWFRDSVLPYALNFKLAQQQTDSGFFRGAAVGQYYLAKKKKFVEEWGEFVEPIGLTYYTMLDLGNILLFEPGNTLLRERLRLGADLLLHWQKPDGSWEVAYDRHTQQPLFTDLQDLRATFYGLLVAYRILKEEKYLDAAKKGADWLIRNGVEKGSFIGVCGDTRYAPDFATAQTAQALLDLYDLTGEAVYRQAAIVTGRFYVSSIYTQPVASRRWKTVKGIPRQDWEISQSGLSFEHGGIIGSANGAGPIMLCSHAGLFIRLFGLTHDPLFSEMARAAAIGRDAFVDSATSVASYYWSTMNKGAGPYPHHAWWQIGWITDYLLAEAQLRSGGKIVFPRGFITPKVGPHETYGFAPGTIFGSSAGLIAHEGLAEADNPDVEVITALATDKRRLFVILLNDLGATTGATVTLDMRKLAAGKNFRITGISAVGASGEQGVSDHWTVSLPSYGISVFAVDIE